MSGASSDDRVPSFIIVGAAKAATTWIAHQLRSRPDVFLPGPEPHYFSRDYARGPTWYATCFAGADPGQRVGEKSADYLADPNAPRRIARDLPDVRLIAQLRNPVERAYSDYCMLYRRGHVGRDIAAALDRSRTTQPRFLDDGLYAQHLARYFDHFPREQIRIVLHEDIRSNPVGAAGVVTDFLALPTMPIAEADRRVNDSAATLLPLPVRHLLGPFKGLAAPLRTNPAFRTVRDLFARPVDYPPFDPAVRARVEDFYRDDVDRLARMIDRDLGGWFAPVAVAA